MKQIRLIALSLLLGMAATQQPTYAATGASDPAWDLLIQARRDFQNGLATLASQKWADEAPEWEKYRLLQLSLLYRKDLVFRYWLRTNPTRIERDKGVEKFANVGWSPNEDKFYRSEIPGFTEASYRVTVLREQLFGKGGNSRFGRRIRQLSMNTEYLRLMREAQREFRSVETLLHQTKSESSASEVAPVVE